MQSMKINSCNFNRLGSVLMIYKLILLSLALLLASCSMTKLSGRNSDSQYTQKVESLNSINEKLFKRVFSI